MKKAGSGLNNTNKILKKSKNKISSSKIKEKTSYINLASTGNNSTRSTNTQTPLFISTTLLSFEYEYKADTLIPSKTSITAIAHKNMEEVKYNDINEIQADNYEEDEKTFPIPKFLNDEDEEAIARHFYSIHKFIVIAGFAHDKTVEELTAIASSNRNK